MHSPDLPLGGTIPALVTPFRPGDGELDEPALACLALRAVSRGATAVVACGSTGEAAALLPAEQARAIRTLSDALGGRVPLVAGIGGSCTQAAVDLALAARACGATALLCAAPPYVRPSQDGMAAHLRAVSRAASLPVILYDVPARTGVRFADETVAQLFEAGAITAIKDATADLSRPARLRRLCGPGLRQLSGDDATALAHLAQGGTGCISVSANIAPGLCAALQRAWRQGDLARAQALDDLLAPLHEALFAASNPGPVKAALGLLGLCDWTPRLPLLRAGDALLARLEALLPEVMQVEDEGKPSSFSEEEEAKKLFISAASRGGLSANPH